MATEKIKMYCIFSAEAIKLMNGNRGKLAAQAGHAFLHSWWDAEGRFPSYYGGIGGDSVQAPDDYKDGERAYKICLITDTTEQLKELEQKYKFVCGVSLVTDAAFTVFDGPTITCLGLGPIREQDIGEDLKELKVLI